MPCARPFARANAGNKIAARMAMMAITTSNSIRVNPFPFAPLASAEVRETGKMVINTYSLESITNI